MHWRNIHIQNPYADSGLKTDRLHRFTPKRKERSGSEHDCSVFSVSYSSKQHGSQKGSRSKSKRQLVRFSTNKSIMVSQQWVMNVKNQFNKLVEVSHTLCVMFKTHLRNVDKTLKQQSNRIRDETLKRINEFTLQVLTAFPKNDQTNHSIKPYHQHYKINDMPSQMLVPPFVLNDCQFDTSSLNQIMSISKSIDKKDRQQNSHLNNHLDLCICGRAINPELKTVGSTIKKTRSINPCSQLFNEKIESQTAIRNFDNIKLVKNNAIQTIETNPQTKLSQIKSETILRSETQCNPEEPKSSLNQLKQSIRSQSKNLTFDQKYNFYKKMASESSKKKSKNNSMDQTMHNMTTCIESMKKILNNPAKK